MKIRHSRCRGFSLIEAMVAIALFSSGVIGLMALQVTSLRQTGDAGHRATASLLAQELVSRMWVGKGLAEGAKTPDRFQAELARRYAPDGAEYLRWAAEVVAALPTAQASAPAVTLEPDGTVTIDISWKAPNAGPEAPMHRFTTVTQVRR